jgi:hypothetical protein
MENIDSPPSNQNSGPVAWQGDTGGDQCIDINIPGERTDLDDDAIVDLGSRKPENGRLSFIDKEGALRVCVRYHQYP